MGCISYYVSTGTLNGFAVVCKMCPYHMVINFTTLTLPNQKCWRHIGMSAPFGAPFHLWSTVTLCQGGKARTKNPDGAASQVGSFLHKMAM